MWTLLVLIFLRDPDRPIEIREFLMEDEARCRATEEAFADYGSVQAICIPHVRRD